MRPVWLVAWLLSLLAVALLAGGCAAPGERAAPRGGVGEWRGPAQRAEFTTAPWDWRGTPGTELTSAHYRLFTTKGNPAIADDLVQVLEAALPEFRRLAPTVGPVGEPMEAFMFADRAQWADFTRRKTGPQARIYLQIAKGGYTIRDRFVAFFVTERDAWSVTAHEGFHQFAARHFRGRLPPFLEEGLATTFEYVRWEGRGPGRGVPGRGVPRFNTRHNPQRIHALRNSIEARATWPLAELATLHAGKIVGLRAARIEAFYAQSWAFARFVQEYDGGRYLPGFRRWMADVVSGNVHDPTGTHRVATGPWDPNAVGPILEHYLGSDMATLQREFDEWCRQLIRDEFARQWVGG